MQAPNSARRVLTEEIILQKTKVASLSEVRHLNLWGEQLEDVSIIMQLRRVEVVALVANRITELKPFAACAHLQELYLRKNRIDSLVELNALRGLGHLHTMWLMDNPCATKPHYREFAIFCCPQLQHLDDIPVTAAEREAVTERMTPSFVEALLAKESPAAITNGRGGTPRVSTPLSSPLSYGAARLSSPPTAGAGNSGGDGRPPSSSSASRPTPPSSRATSAATAGVPKPTPAQGGGEGGSRAAHGNANEGGKPPKEPVSAKNRPPSPSVDKPARSSPRPVTTPNSNNNNNNNKGFSPSSPSPPVPVPLAPKAGAAAAAAAPPPAVGRTKTPSEARPASGRRVAEVAGVVVSAAAAEVPQEALLSSIRSLLPLLTQASVEQLREELRQQEQQREGAALGRKGNLTPIERGREKKK